jgi:acetyl-CoA carboxylase carboxyltransferase component
LAGYWLRKTQTEENLLVQVVAIANDITYNSGSFGPKEDAAFRAATDYALDRKLPVVYLAANSGARVGLANEVKSALQVCNLFAFAHINLTTAKAVVFPEHCFSNACMASDCANLGACFAAKRVHSYFKLLALV